MAAQERVYVFPSRPLVHAAARPTFSIAPTISLSFRKIQGRRDSSVPAEKCASEKETPGPGVISPRANADSIIQGGQKFFTQKFTVVLRKAGSERYWLECEDRFARFVHRFEVVRWGAIAQG